MLKDLNLPFHGVVLGPLMEDYHGPLINCDSSFAFDETSPFLASSFSTTFTSEYQLLVSSKTTFLFTGNFWVQRLKHLFPFYSKKHPMKMHFFFVFESSYVFFSSRTYTYARQPNILKCEFFFKCHAMNHNNGCLIHDVNCNYYHFCPKVI